MSYQEALAALSSAPGFTGDILTPSDPAYTPALARWSQTGVLPAKAIIYPNGVLALVATVKWATSSGIAIAVKCGGHTISGVSSIDNGVVIDLGKYFSTVSVDPATKQAKVGGGAKWTIVNEETMKYGLATVGPTISDVGVGGHTLGGGYGFLTGAYGLTCDNLVGATLVTADGSIVKTSASENPDLFWAIRGAGGNFGIVVEFVLQLHPQRETVFSGVLAFPGSPDIVKKLFDGAAEWYKTITSNDVLDLFLVHPPEVGQSLVVASVFHNGSEEEGKKVFKFLYEIGPLSPDDAKEVPYTVANTIQAQFAKPGLHYYAVSSSHDPLVNNVSTILYPRLLEIRARPENVIHHAVLFQFSSLKKLLEVHPDATAFAPRDARGNILILLSYEKDDPAVTEQAKKDAFDIAAHATPEGPVEVHYTNFHAEDRAPGSEVEKIFKGNYPRLQQVKAKYDPNEVFSRWFGIEPAA